MGVGVGAGGVFVWGVLRGLASAAKWVIEYFGGRLDRRADRLDASTDKLVLGLEARVDALTNRLDHVESELAECNRKHAEAEARNKQLEAMLQGYGDARQRAQTERSAEIVTIRKETSDGV